MGTASPVVEAQQQFPGHQEFFFIFILSTDCYSFGIHLRNRLKSEILKLVSSSDVTKGVEKRMLQLKLLSRFLGFLIFSPSWHDSGFVGGTHYDGLSEFDPDLDVHGMVERAYKEMHLVITIPWVVEFLRMARWSPTLQKSDEFKRLLALLLGVHHRIRNDEIDELGSLRANMQLVSLYLETLFGDIIGLERASTIPVASVVEPIALPASDDKSRRPDERPLPLSDSLLFTSNSHAEELVVLLSSLSHNQTKASSSPRKLTPYSVGGSLGSSTDPLGNSKSVSFSPVKSKQSTSLGSDIDQLTHADSSYQDYPILAKLVEAFFHQHRDLKDICEFIIDQALKNIAIRMRDECVVPLLEEKLLDATDTISISLGQVEEQAIEASRTFLATELQTTIHESLAILCPPNIQPRVRDIAVELSMSHATRLGEATVESLVQLESKKLSLDNARKLKKQATTLESQTQPGKVDAGSQGKVAGFEDAFATLRNALANRMWERRLDSMAAAVSNTKEALSNTKYEGTSSVHGIFHALEIGSVPLLQWCLQEDCCDASDRWRVASDFLGVITLLVTKNGQAFPNLVFNTVSSYFSYEEHLDVFIKLGLTRSGDSSGYKMIAGLLHDLTRVKLIPPAKVEIALIQSLQSHDDGRSLCQSFVSRVDEGCTRNGANAENKNFPKSYARLRRELSENVTLN